jgi:hypothetical protein
MPGCACRQASFRFRRRSEADRSSSGYPPPHRIPTEEGTTLGLRALLIALVIAAIAACSSGAPASPTFSETAGQSGSTVPSLSTGASPGATVDELLCGTIGDLDSNLQLLEAIKLKPANRSKVKVAADALAGAYPAISEMAPAALKPKATAVKAALDALSSAVENWSTSPRPDTAATAVRKATANVHKAIIGLRTAANCGN